MLTTGGRSNGEDGRLDFMRMGQCQQSIFAYSFACTFLTRLYSMLYSLLEIKLSLHGQRLDCSVKGSGTGMCTRALMALSISAMVEGAQGQRLDCSAKGMCNRAVMTFSTSFLK